MIYYVPIEPLKERYTESWYRNIQAFFVKNADTRVQRIEGAALSNTIKVGTFLDVNSTVHYKMTQLQYIASLFYGGFVKDGDWFFFGDIEFWGIESVRLMAQLNNVRIRIFGFLHAASYTHMDAFAVAEPYQKYTECGWIAACDEVFVGSKYHKRAVVSRRLQRYAKKDANLLADKIHVTGNPMFKEDYENWSATEVPKKRQIILPNRFDTEKGFGESLYFAQVLKHKDPTINIVVCSPHQQIKTNRQFNADMVAKLAKDRVIDLRLGVSKEEYHRLLAESKAMWSMTQEENFGYCVAEACLYNCTPVIQNMFSHPELVHDHSACLWDSHDAIIPMTLSALEMQDTFAVREFATKYFKSMDRIWDVMCRYAEEDW